MARRMAIIAGTLIAAMAVPCAAAETPAKPASGDLTTAPAEILGAWKMVGEKCEEGETPGTRQINALIRFDRDFVHLGL